MITQNAQVLFDIKNNIKQALENKGVDMVGIPFTEYASKIGEIETNKSHYDLENGWTSNTMYAPTIKIAPNSANTYMTLDSANGIVNGQFSNNGTNAKIVAYYKFTNSFAINIGGLSNFKPDGTYSTGGFMNWYGMVFAPSVPTEPYTAYSSQLAGFLDCQSWSGIVPLNTLDVCWLVYDNGFFYILDNEGKIIIQYALNTTPKYFVFSDQGSDTGGKNRKFTIQGIKTK